MKKVIGYCGGVFDYAHIGHERLLRRCRAICDQLVIGVHTDKAAEAYKCKPGQDENTRLRQIIKLNITDKVELIGISHEPMYKKYQITHLLHGDDWDRNAYIKHMGKDLFEKYKLSLIFIPHTQGISSTLLRAKKTFMDNVMVCFFDINLLQGDSFEQAIQFINICVDQGMIFYFYSKDTLASEKRDIESLETLRQLYEKQMRLSMPQLKSLEIMLLQKIIKEHNISPDNLLLFFSKEIPSIDLGHAVGCRTILVSKNRLNQENIIAKPTYIIDDLEVLISQMRFII